MKDLFDERISAFLDSELSPAEREQVESLLRDRPDLRELADELREIGVGVRSLPRHELGDHFVEKVMAAVRENSTDSPVPVGSRRWLVMVLGAAAVAATVLVIVALRHNGDEIAEPVAPKRSAAEQAVAELLDAGTGEAVVLRVRMTKDEIRARRLDEALAAGGISLAPASAANPAAKELTQSYKSLASKQGSQGAAGDVVFVEAPRDKLIAALANLADPSKRQAISSDAVLDSRAAGAEVVHKQEGEGGSGKGNAAVVDQRNYAQHLPPRGFPLLKPVAEPEKSSSQQPAAAAKETRVLIIVEVAE